MALSPIEMKLFVNLFNRNGYVLNFTTSDFNCFTYQSIGKLLCVVHGQSKGKSLSAYINDESVLQSDKEKPLFDLLEYYERTYCIREEWFESAEAEKYGALYKQCRQIAEREKSQNSTAMIPLTQIAETIGTPYISSQLDLIRTNIETNPTVAIGKCKELVETICQFILREIGSNARGRMKLSKLVEKTIEALGMGSEKHQAASPEDTTVQDLLGNLINITDSISTLRNEHGDGHGKNADYVGLQPRYARLALGATSTLVGFLWDTFSMRREENNRWAG